MKIGMVSYFDRSIHLSIHRSSLFHTLLVHTQTHDGWRRRSDSVTSVVGERRRRVLSWRFLAAARQRPCTRGERWLGEGLSVSGREITFLPTYAFIS